MRRLLPAVFIILFPYFIVFLICSFFQQDLMKTFFQDNAYLGILYLGILWVAAFLSAVVICVGNLVRKRDVLETARTNMLIKLVQIPAYAVIFVIGCGFALSIFGIGVALLLMLLDGASIILSGLVGVSAVKRSHAVKHLSTGEAVIHGILQFVFCADIVSAVIVYGKAKKS